MRFSKLSKRQKGMLAQVARRAFDRLRALFAVDSDESFDEWRRGVAGRECGARISEARQDHFCALMGRFSELAGDVEQAFYWFSREGVEASESEGKRVSLFTLRRALKSARLDDSYALKIARSRFGEGVKVLGDLDEAQAREVMFTVLNRASSKSGRGSSKSRNKGQAKRAKASSKRAQEILAEHVRNGGESELDLAGKALENGVFDGGQRRFL